MQKRNCYQKNLTKMEFTWRFTEVDEKDNIIKLTCKVCCTHLQQTRVEARTRNVCVTALDSLLKYADGISYANKGNADKHGKSGGFHDWAKQNFQGNVTEQHKNVPVVENFTRYHSSAIKHCKLQKIFCNSPTHSNERETYIRFWRSDRIAAKEQFNVFTRKVAWKGISWIHWCASWYIKERH